MGSALSVGCRQLLSCCVLTLLFLGVCTRRELSAASYKFIEPIELVPHTMTSFNLNYNYFLTPQTATVVVRASIYDYYGDTHIQSITLSDLQVPHPPPDSEIPFLGPPVLI